MLAQVASSWRNATLLLLALLHCAHELPACRASSYCASCRRCMPVHESKWLLQPTDTIQHSSLHSHDKAHACIFLSKSVIVGVDNASEVLAS